MRLSRFPTILGILGYPVTHSLSPLMHNIAFSHHKLDYMYVPFEVQPSHLSDAIQGVRSLGIKGVNVTVPHKKNVMQYLDTISTKARLIGAVNTISVENGKMAGYNTDGIGFSTSIKTYTGISFSRKKVLILGAGGAARAVAVQLALEKASAIVIANRTQDRAEELAQHIKNNVSKNLSLETTRDGKNALKKYLDHIDIIVNTTSQGMSKKHNIKKFPYECITANHIVCDLVYNPLETYFLKECKKKGAKTVDGLGMLIHQGSYSFKIWTKKKLPITIVEPILRKKLKGD